LDYFDNTNGSEVIATVDGLSQILLEELGTSQGSAFFSAETLLANDTDITNASVTNVSITSAEGSLVDLGNGYFQYTPSSDEKYGTADHPTFTYTVNYDDINGNNTTTTQTFVIQTSLVQAINQGTDGDDTMLFSPGLHDAIDGGTGDDTLIANEAFSNYVVGSLNDNVIMQDADSFTSFITSMENFTFNDQSFTAAELAANNDVRPLFSTSESLVSGQWSNGFILPDLFSSGDAALDALYDYQFIGDSSGEILGASSANDFINSSAGDDAINAGAGNDVIDGGLGSNFLTGGTGNDVFFSDGRGAANGDNTWSTITDFTSGSNMVNIWGYVDGVSSYAWYADQGAAGYTGATIHADIDGDGLIDTSMTFSGMDIVDMNTPLALDNGTAYLFVA
jgi:Ca2+-binding RTX toxin-like protein